MNEKEEQEKLYGRIVHCADEIIPRLAGLPSQDSLEAILKLITDCGVDCYGLGLEAGIKIGVEESLNKITALFENRK